MIKKIDKIPGYNGIDTVTNDIQRDIEIAIKEGVKLFELTEYNAKDLMARTRTVRQRMTVKAIRDKGFMGPHSLISKYSYVLDWLKLSGRKIDGVKHVYCELDYDLLDSNIEKAIAEYKDEHKRYR